ncbi:hypothetical protein, conserved [Eimeria tenella]|uniref:Pentacotripeptide-repeat region of PRORP domain-containing protein n=1 Tax=Eimeria tenella TaxID=5802 RepID=U6KYL7_EIMTE|nr:hypothetical protein, conserved [Eimeria tenella]CDJ42013.1 hypothetical protein, conserved [Eimeria tenella]|eukprot:XP_013232763.1 hypothetical protein, conserved [Eimeria tenella]
MDTKSCSVGLATRRLLLLLLLQLQQQQFHTATAATLGCPTPSAVLRFQTLRGLTLGFLSPAVQWGVPACRRSRCCIINEAFESCSRYSGSSGPLGATDRHLEQSSSHFLRSATAGDSHSSQLQQQEKQQQADDTPQIDLARALQLLEAASTGGPPIGEEGALWVSSAVKNPPGSPKRQGMGEKKRLAVIFNCMLHACERQGDSLGGFEVYKQMRASGAPPDDATFHSIAALMERAGEYHGMLKLLEHIKEEGHEPSLAVLSLAVSSCSKAGAASAALQLAQQLQRRIRAAAAAVAPAAAAAVATAAAGLQHAGEAVARAAEALQQALPSSVYTALICCCVKAGRYEKAIQLYADFCALRHHQEVLQQRVAQQQHQQSSQQQKKQPQQQQQDSGELEPEMLQHLQQLLQRDSYLPMAPLVNAAIAAATATGRLQLAMSIFQRDLLGLQQQQQQHGQDHLTDEIFGSFSAAEAHAPTTETFLSLLAAAQQQQSSSTVDSLLREFEEQQQQRQQQQLLPLDAAAVYAAAAEALAVGGRWREGLQLLVHSHAERQQQQQQTLQQLQHLIGTQRQLHQQQLEQLQPLLQAYPPFGSVAPYLTLLRCCAAAAAPREALGVLRLLQQRHQQQLQVFDLQQQLQKGQHDSLLAAAAAVPPEFPLIAFAEVMAAAAAAADWQLLISVVAEFESPKVQQQSAAAAAAAAAFNAQSVAEASELCSFTSCDKAAATAAAARAAAALSQQHIPLEQRVRIAALKLLGLLHTGNFCDAADQRRQLLLLLERPSNKCSISTLPSPGPVNAVKVQPELQQQLEISEEDLLISDALKLAEKLLGPAQQQPRTKPDIRQRLQEDHGTSQQQRVEHHQKLLSQQIRQYYQSHMQNE